MQDFWTINSIIHSWVRWIFSPRGHGGCHEVRRRTWLPSLPAVHLKWPSERPKHSCMVYIPKGFPWDFGIFTDPWMVDFYGKCRLNIIPVIHGWYGCRIHPTVFWATKVPLSNAFCWHGWRFASWFYLLNTFQMEGSPKWFMNILFGNFGTS